MVETERVSAKYYEELMKDEEHHEPHNLVLSTMIERLKTFPDRVNRLVFGFWWLSYRHLAMQLRAKVSSVLHFGKFERGEECSPCDRNKDLFSDLITQNTPNIVLDRDLAKFQRVDGRVVKKADSRSETGLQKTIDSFFG